MRIVLMLLAFLIGVLCGRSLSRPDSAPLVMNAQGCIELPNVACPQGECTYERNVWCPSLEAK